MIFPPYGFGQQQQGFQSYPTNNYGRQGIKCFTCGRLGHTSRFCQQQSRSNTDAIILQMAKKMGIEVSERESIFLPQKFDKGFPIPLV